MPTQATSCVMVFPDGFEESTVGDKYHWILYVERMRQEDGSILWRVSRSHGQRGMVLTRGGKWIYDTSFQKRWTRHSFNDAMALAYRHVNTAGPMGWTLQQFEEHFRKRERQTT